MKSVCIQMKFFFHDNEIGLEMEWKSRLQVLQKLTIVLKYSNNIIERLYD